MSNKNIAYRECAKMTFLSYATKKPYLYVDYANVTTTGLTGEVTYAYGGDGHAKRISFPGERGGTITFETQVQPFRLFGLISGADIETSATWLKREKLTSSGSGTFTLTLTKSPASTSYLNVFKEDDDCGTALTVSASGTTVTLPVSETTAGNYYAYYYTTTTSGVQKISIKPSTFPGFFTVQGETVSKNEDGEYLPYKYFVYKCAPQTNFDISMANSGDPSTLTITCDLLVDGDNPLVDMILFDEEAGDASVDLLGIALNKNATSIADAATETLTVTYTPTTATNKTIIWTSNDEEVATVSAAGVVTGVAQGVASIVAVSEDGNFVDSCAVTVTA